jgi:AcrR family transcriptional regulator
MLRETEAPDRQSSPNRQARRKLRTQALIKTATLALLSERGYEDFSVGDIAERADIGRGTFYTHYADKDAVVWEVLRESFKDYGGATQLPDLPDCPCGHDDGYCFWLRIFWRADHQRALYRHLLAANGAAHLSLWVGDYLAQLVDERFEGLFGPRPTAERAYLVQFCAGALLRLLTWWLTAEESVAQTQDYVRMARQFQTILRALGAQP